MPRTKEQLLQTVIDAASSPFIRAPSAEILSPHRRSTPRRRRPRDRSDDEQRPRRSRHRDARDKLGDGRLVRRVGRCSTPPLPGTRSPAGAPVRAFAVFDEEVVRHHSAYGKSRARRHSRRPKSFRAWTAGADVVKIFPDALGPVTSGPARPAAASQGLADRRRPTRKTPETGSSGAVCVGAGSSLVTKDAMAERGLGVDHRECGGVYRGD